MANAHSATPSIFWIFILYSITLLDNSQSHEFVGSLRFVSKNFPTFGNFDNFRSNSRKLIVDYLKLAGFELLPTSKVEIEKSVWHWMNHPRILISEIYSPNVLRNRFTVLWLRNRSLMSVVLSQLKLLIRSHFQFWFCSHLSQHGKSELLTLYSR